MAAAAALAGLLIVSLSGYGTCSLSGIAFNGMFVEDALAVFFKRFFIIAAIRLLLVMSAEFSDRIAAGIGEYYSLIVFALAGMLFAASANDFAMLFVSIELITITFYVLTSFQRGRLVSLEAGVKYLILGALSSAFLVFGIALIWGTTGKLNFTELGQVSAQFLDNKIFLLGVLFVLVGLGFKIAAFPFQIWAPDVYQGAPTPTTAFLAVGSKAAGFVLLLRVLFTAFSRKRRGIGRTCSSLFPGITILYGNLCALPQRNLKRLLGYYPGDRARGPFCCSAWTAFEAAGGGAGIALYYLARISVHGHRGIHRDLPRDAAFGQRRHFCAGGIEQAFAGAGGDNDAGDGFARGHSTARRVFRKIFTAEISDRNRTGHAQPWLLLPRIHGAGWRNYLSLLLFWRGARDLLERRHDGCVAD